MDLLLDNVLVVLVAVPLLLALITAVVGNRARALAPVLALVAPLLTAAVGAAALARVAGTPAQAQPWTSELAAAGSVRWFTLASAHISIGWAVDSLAASMLVVVGVVASCVVVFSVGYLHGEKGWARYFALLAAFCGAMSLLVVADSFAALFVGWELVGACSYLLIGFWFTKPSAAAAAVKAFLTTRVGDVGLLLGIALLWSAAKTTGYVGVMAEIGSMPAAIVTAAGLLLAIGALGKSAQFPFQAWLPDAMEGPTPVSALIHAATMVAAGVYLVARVFPLYELAPLARGVLLAAGLISAVGAAFAAVPQRDIKKVLAYSTISQLGLMFCALGVGAWEVAMFHLVAHAAFKALLFLTSGSVIHGSGTQDLHEMGGLRRTMPFTFGAWVVGALALAGVWPLAGFFSKDAVLEAVWHGAPVVGLLLFGSSALTAFYLARATRLAFFGRSADGSHAHESGASMLVPLAVLAVPSIGLGWTGARFALALGVEPEPLVIAVSAAALACAVLGGVAGWWAFPDAAADERVAARFGSAWTLARSGFGWDAVVDRVIVRPAVWLSRALWAIGDRFAADGAAEGLAGLARFAGAGLSALQSGNAQSYAAVAVIAMALMLAATVWIGGW